MKKTSLHKGALYITISTFTFVISGYLINILLGRFLGPTVYGIYGLLLTLMTVMNLTQTSGLPLAVSKFIAEDEEKANAILKSGLVIQIISTIIASIIFFLLAVPLAKILNDISLVPYLRLTSLIFPFYGIYTIYANYYNGLHLFKTQAFIQIVYSISKLFSILILVYFFQVYGAIIGFIISPLIALLFFYHFPKKDMVAFPHKKLILYAVPLIGFAIFSNLLQSIDLIFVKALLHGDKYTGLYTADQNIAEIPFYGVAALASVLFPSISKHVKQNLTEDTKKLISNALRFTLLITLPSILLISATSLTLLRFLYSSSYNQGADSLAILAIANCFFTIFVMLTTIISGSGHPLKSSILAGIGVVISSTLCLFLIPSMGLLGAALSTTIAAFVVMVGAAIIVYQKFTVLFSLASTVKIICAAFIIYLLARIIIIPVPILPILYIILFLIYIGLLVLFKEIREDDIQIAKNLMPNWLRFIFKR